MLNVLPLIFFPALSLSAAFAFLWLLPWIWHLDVQDSVVDNVDNYVDFFNKVDVGYKVSYEVILWVKEIISEQSIGPLINRNFKFEHNQQYSNIEINLTNLLKYRKRIDRNDINCLVSLHLFNKTHPCSSHCQNISMSISWL